MSVILNCKFHAVGFHVTVLCRCICFYQGVFLIYFQNTFDVMRDRIAVFVCSCGPGVDDCSIFIPDFKHGTDYVLSCYNVLLHKAKLGSVVMHGHMDIIQCVPHLIKVEVRV